MRNSYLLLIGFLLTSTAVFSQQIDVSGLYSSSTLNTFKDNWGFDVGYNHFINNNRLGVSFRYYAYNTEYDDIFMSNADGVSKDITEHDPQNRRIAINLIYSYSLIKNEKSNLYLGCNVGLNYFKLQEKVNQTANGFMSERTYEIDETINNRLGFGILIEYEIKKVILDRLSTSIKINPELTAYEKWGMTGTYDPWMIGWLNISIGLKYTL